MDQATADAYRARLVNALGRGEELVLPAPSEPEREALRAAVAALEARGWRFNIREAAGRLRLLATERGT
jgi:hypothetical protein